MKERSKKNLILTSLFALKSPKFSLYSREKVGSFTTNVIFLENKNIKWSKKKKQKLWILDASEPNRNTGWSLREGAWDRRPQGGRRVVTPPLALWQGPCSPAGRGATVSESVCLRVHCQGAVWSMWASESNMILILRHFCPCLSCWPQPLSLVLNFCFSCAYIHFLRNAQFLYHFSCTKFHYVSET